MPEKWSREELLNSVIAYKQMQNNSRLVKQHVYRGLAAKYPNRNAKAFEYRMQNISAVLSFSGREWLPGLKPATHIGPTVTVEIENILAEIEGRVPEPDFVLMRSLLNERKDKMPGPPPQGKKNPQKRISAATTYDRDVDVVKWILDQAKGVCELCKNEAPFLGLNGLPFLEVHHVKHLADGGSDTITNAAALCPNCHREIHYGIDSIERKSQLYRSVSRLIFE